MRAGFTILLALAMIACAPEAEEAVAVDESIKKAIAEFQNRQIYRSLDASILASIPDAEIELAIVDYVHAKVGGRYEQEVEIVSKLPAGIRALYVTWGVQAEVHNGGFNQYYWNSSSKFAEQAVAAFEFFSAHEHADLMREANRIRAKEKAEIEKLKEKGTIEAFSESYEVSELGPLDGRFYKLDQSLSVLRVAKIRAEPSFFIAE